LSSLIVAAETPLQDDVARLFSLAEQYFNGLYPNASHVVEPSTLVERGATLFLARQDGAAVGCGALLPAEAHGEIKRMFVLEAARGRGVGSRILDHIETEARRRALPALMMETGIRQPDAIALYRRRGFVERGPFGDYHLDPMSLFFEKTLASLTE
jgi:putative acetyltransferase